MLCPGALGGVNNKKKKKHQRHQPRPPNRRTNEACDMISSDDGNDDNQSNKEATRVATASVASPGRFSEYRGSSFDYMCETLAFLRMSQKQSHGESNERQFKHHHDHKRRAIKHNPNHKSNESAEEEADTMNNNKNNDDNSKNNRNTIVMGKSMSEEEVMIDELERALAWTIRDAHTSLEEMETYINQMMRQVRRKHPRTQILDATPSHFIIRAQRTADHHSRYRYYPQPDLRTSSRHQRKYQATGRGSATAATVANNTTTTTSTHDLNMLMVQLADLNYKVSQLQTLLSVQEKHLSPRRRPSAPTNTSNPAHVASIKSMMHPIVAALAGITRETISVAGSSSAPSVSFDLSATTDGDEDDKSNTSSNNITATITDLINSTSSTISVSRSSTTAVTISMDSDESSTEV